MGWSASFLAGLASGAPRLFIVEVRQVGNVPGQAGILAATVPGLGVAAISTVVVNGSMLSPGAWGSTLGTATVVLVGDLAGVKRRLTRGTFVEIRCGFAGWLASDYERIFVGQVQQLRATHRSAGILELRDLQSALQCRPDVDAGQAALFYADDAETTVDGVAYTVGDATLQVVSTTGFERAAGYHGGLLVDNGTDAPFLLRWSASTSTEFTIEDAGSDQHGTIRANAATGSTVRAVFFLDAHPIDAARIVLTSTGSGGNGDYDVAPVSWGLGLPADWIDDEDCDSYKLNSLDAMTWEFLLDQQQDTPATWLGGILALGGFYLTMRQGALTVRAGLMSTLESAGVSAASITAGRDQLGLDDHDIASVTWEAWDADSPAEYVNVTAYSDGGSSSAGTEDPATLPVTYRAEFDLSEVLWSSQAAGRENVVGRLWEAAQRVPERYTLTLAGLRAAGLAPGDFVRVSTDRIAGRLERTLEGLDDARLVVTQVGVDWGRGIVTLTGLCYPTTGDAFP